MPDPADKGTRRQSSSSSSSSSSPPPSPSTPPRPRWFYAREGSDDWAAFPTVDDKELEKRFQELGGEEWWKVEAGKRREEKRRDRREKREEEARREGGAAGDGSEHAKGKSGAKQAEKQKQQDGENDAAAGWTDQLASWIPGLASSDGDKDQDQDAAKEKERQGLQKDDSSSDSDEDDDDDPPFDPSHPPLIEEILSPDSPPDQHRHLVPVLEDHLFDVDLISMHLYPAFFKGVLLKVVRSTWFYWSEMRGSYEPVSWESRFAGDLEEAWRRTEAYKLPVEDNSQEDGRKTEMVEIRSSKATSSGKGRVCFTSPVEGQVFTEDLRGRIVSLVGGFTVLRGFDEVERRTTGKEDGSDGGAWSRFDLPDMPWMSRSKGGEGDDEEGRDAQVNDAVRSTGKAGAAQPGKGKPPSADNDASAKVGDSDGSTNEGFAARLWPSNEAWMRPGYAVRRALGWSDDEAREEAKRSKKQKSTEKTVEPDSEVRKRAHKDKDNEDGQNDDDSDSEASSEDEDEVADAQNGATNKAQDPPLDDRSDDPVHLVLVIHGIGQGLRDDFESLDFTYDCAKLRSVSKERAQDLGIRRLARGRRAQFLPICWRRGLDFSHRAEGNDNHFGLDDVTNEATMPLVRNVVSKVILDVPFYLSPIYKEKFIKAVVAELNRCYRLWIQRNPGWLEKGGKVSIIGHSLGSVLAADILSRQPMKVPRVDELSSEEVAEKGKERLLFDVHHLFLVGSPLGLFLLLGGGQLIARPTTSAKRNVGEDATQDNDGGEDAKYGCMALRGNLYNVYNESDPVAYRLSAAVDRDYAKRLKPMPLPGAVAAILDTLRGPPRMSVSSFFDKERPFASLWGSEAGQKEEKSEGKEDKGGLTPGEDPPIRWGETRDERVDDEDKDKFVDRAAKKLGDKGEAREKVENDVESKESNKARSRGRHSADSQLPSGIVTPVRVESGHDVKASLPLRLAATATASASTTNTSSSSSSSSYCPRLRSLLDSYARAERRFRALNAHGCLDYSYVSDVVGRFDSTLTKTTAMLGAHQSYWGSKSFVSLVLSQVFAEEAGGEEGEEDEETGKKKNVVVDTETTLVPQIEKGEGKDDKEKGSKSKKMP